LSFELFVNVGINGKLRTSLMSENSPIAVCLFDREKYLKISGNPSLKNKQNDKELITESRKDILRIYIKNK